VEEIEKETTPGRYIEWTLAYRHDDKTYSSVSDGKMSKGGKGEGSSVFRRGRWMLRNGNDSLLRRDAERINELSCCAPEQKKKKKRKNSYCEQMEANGSIFILTEHARRSPSGA